MLRRVRARWRERRAWRRALAHRDLITAIGDNIMRDELEQTGGGW